MTNKKILSEKRGWLVALSGLGINLALGILYAWSLIKGKIADSFGWDKAQLNDPYALCCLVFAFAMILAGRCQDKFGPRVTASIGGLLVGAGLYWISTSNSYQTWLLGFGVLVGTGIGFGYSAATPAALKWFPAVKTGLIAGIVVAGFGLAPVYLAPLTEHLMRDGVLHTMGIYAVCFTIAVVGLAQLLRNPPNDVKPNTNAVADKSAGATASPTQMLRSPMFYLLWVIFFIGSGAGLMVISSVGGMAKKSMGESAFIAVAMMAIGNASGRVTAGILSDKIGRRGTLMLVLFLQAVLMFIAIPVTASPETAAFVIVAVASLIGFNYGANLCLFPSFTKDFWGLKNFGMNYGVLFTAWGMGGFVLSRLQQMLTAASNGSYRLSFVTAGVLLLLGAGMTFFIKPPRLVNETR